MHTAGIPDAPATIAELPFFAGGRHPRPDLIGRCRGGRVELTSGRQLVERVRDIGLGLTTLGMRRGDRVILLSESRPEWLFVDFAILASGAVTTPVYPTLSVEQLAFILRDSDAAFAVVSTPAQLTKLLAASAPAPGLRTIIVMDAEGRGADWSENPPNAILTLAEVEARGHRRILDGWGVGREFHDAAKQIQPGDAATIIYTSGTTGEPKGVILTHGNLIANVTGVRQVLDLGPDDAALSFLPLCHAFERLVAYVYLTSGVSTVFAESFDTLARDLQVVRPTVMTGVPRIFEKLHARILSAGREAGGIKAVIFDWAVRVAAARGRHLSNHGTTPAWLRVQSWLAERLVFQDIRSRLGGRLRFAVSGSAPLQRELAEFFYGFGLPILEGYGLTETSPVLTVVPIERPRFGTVGPPLPNVEIRIADDGEILARGPNVMAGYHKRPRETAEVLQDGWFHTGDIGTFDAAGYLRITDRKKELIVTSGGKKIAPQPIEAALRASDVVAEAVVVGEKRHFPAVLLVPDFAAAAKRLNVPPPDSPAAAQAFVDRAEVREMFDTVVGSLNARLAQFERLKKFTLLPREFSVEAGELTPTLKIKRRVIEQKYRDVIEGMYS